jgi:hypothetical protein
VKTLRKLLGKLFGLLLAFTLFTLAYLHAIGFPGFLTKGVVDQFAKRGLAAQFGLIRLDLFRGVVATDAVLADAKTPDLPLLQIDELEIQLNWRRLIHRQNAVDAVRIANAVITVPTPPDEIGRQYLTAEDAYALFKFENDGTIRVDRLTGLYCGIRLNVTGQFKPGAEQRPPAAETEERPLVFLTKTVRELNRVQVAKPPQLDLDFQVDLGRPFTDQHVTARLYGADLLYRGLRVDAAVADVQLQSGAIDINRFLVKLYGGDLSVTGRYDVAHGRFDIQFVSTTDPTALRTLLPRDAAAGVRELHVHENPKITAHYVLSAETGSLPRLQGEVNAGPLSYRAVDFDRINFSFSHQWPEVQLSDVSIAMADGRLTGHGQYHLESSDFSYEIDCTLDPTKLLPLMTPATQQLFQPARFETPPRISAVVTGDLVDPDSFAYDAEVSAGRMSYRGVPLRRASAGLSLRHGRLDVQDLHLIREEGELRGHVLADFNEHDIAFEFDTTAAIPQLAALLGEKAARIVAPYRFGPNSAATAQGLLDFDEPAKTAWTAQIDTEGFSWWKLTADRAKATLIFTNNTLRVENFSADIYKGTLRGDVVVALDNPETQYRASFDAANCDVDRLMVALRGEGREVSGSLAGHVELRGHGSDLKTMTGSGHVEILDGVLVELPLFGVFSRILNDISPGAGSTKITRARATFAVAKGAVKTDDLGMAAGAFSVSSRGEVDFDGKLDFRVQAQFLRSVPPINVLTAIIGKIFEYKVGGTLANPNYRPLHLPKETMPHG